MNCVCIVHLICLNLCVQAGPTSNLLDESELLTGWEVLAIKNRMREVQAMKASARATKASAVVGLAGDQSSFSEVITCTFIIVELVLILIKFLFDYLFLSQEWEVESTAG